MRGILALAGGFWGVTLIQSPEQDMKFWGALLIGIALLNWRHIIHGTQGGLRWITGLLLLLTVIWIVNGKSSAAEFFGFLDVLWIAPALLLVFLIIKRTPTGYKIWWKIKTKISSWIN